MFFDNSELKGVYMSESRKLLDNISNIHNTKMGVERIKRNLGLSDIDVVEYCKNKISDKNCRIRRQGKNWYCEIDNIVITINSYSYTIITAHIQKRGERKLPKIL